MPEPLNLQALQDLAREAKEWVRIGFPTKDMVVQSADAILALTAEVERLRAENRALQAAIRDDSHATPLAADEDGYAAMGYAVAVGAIHRALGLAMGTGVPCAMCGPESHDCPGLASDPSTPPEPR